jgi:hypothetical protein
MRFVTPRVQAPCETLVIGTIESLSNVQDLCVSMVHSVRPWRQIGQCRMVFWGLLHKKYNLSEKNILLNDSGGYQFRPETL